MKISLNHIKSLIPGLDTGNTAALFSRMVEIGLDIESIEYEGNKFRNFIIGEVISAEKHANADKLTKCSVSIGSEVLSIVCGAPNVQAGQKVCVAKIGAVIPKGGFEIKKNKIRGELSEGMICAEDELGLSGDHSGIMILAGSAPVGTDFASYAGFDDYIIEIGVTPNRGDLFSQIGMAREIAAAHGLKIEYPDTPFTESAERSDEYISVEIVSGNYCKRFTGRVVKDVDVKESPDWLKKALTSLGLRPRNNIVDITNFVMMETGQPLHAFDYDKIREKKIIVRTANEGDKFTTLDSKERLLNSESLMICDGEGYSAIAGIMGGERSEISDTTKNVFIESAFFDAVCIRRNSKQLGMQTDASQRFERGVDISRTAYASDRAASLMQLLAGGKVLNGIIDVYPEPFPELLVGLRRERAEKIIGIELTDEKIISLLRGIEIRFTEKKDGNMIFRVPEFRRNDISREIDLIEETARLYGYINIGSRNDFRMDMSSHIDFGDDYRNFISCTREYFIGRGFNEIITFSQQHDKIVRKFNENPALIANPNSVDMNAMRANLLYGMLTAIKNNQNYSGRDVSLKLFEIGKVFGCDNNIFKEENYLCFADSGRVQFRIDKLADLYSYNENDKYYDFFDIKGELIMYLSKLKLETYKFIYYNSNEGFFDICLGSGNNSEIIGRIYNVNRELLDSLGIETGVYAVEVNMDKLSEYITKDVKYAEIRRYPAVKRDIAVVAGKSIHYSEIYDVIRTGGGSMLKEIELFDVYTDEKLGNDKRSITFTLEFSSNEKTLTDDEVSKQVEKIFKALNNKLGAVLRN
jgi:phenylalanyl-tRNA synthetase beta chain